MDKKTLKEIEEEIIVFKNINSTSKKVFSNHTNFSSGNHVKPIRENQGVARAKLREFIKKENVDYDYWKGL